MGTHERSVLGLLPGSTTGTGFSPSGDGNSDRQLRCAASGQQPDRLLEAVVVGRTCRAVEDMGQAEAEGDDCKDLERLVRKNGRRPCRREEAVVEDSLMEDKRTEDKMAEDMKTDAMEDNSADRWSENRSIVDAPMEDAGSRGGLARRNRQQIACRQSREEEQRGSKVERRKKGDARETRGNG